MISSSPRQHVVVVTDAQSSYLYGPFPSVFAAKSWVNLHRTDFAGRTVHVAPSQPITPDHTWIVTMDSHLEEVDFRVTAQTEDEALYEAQQLMESSGRVPDDYKLIAVRIA